MYLYIKETHEKENDKKMGHAFRYGFMEGTNH